MTPDPSARRATESADEPRVIYVSSSLGNDANDGRSWDTAVQTIRRAQEIVRDVPAFFNLKPGDSFRE